jgi:hypothetical protein
LTINRPGENDEQEADRASERVLSLPAWQQPRACVCGGRCPTCKNQPADRIPLQMKRRRPSDTEGIEAPPLVHEVLRSPGQSLDPSTREFMESGFGHDFSRVRVHADDKAAESSLALNAQAYTVGEHVVFAPNRYDHATDVGRRLIAHELAHVVQQSGGAIALQRQPQTRQGGPEVLSDEFDEMTRELREMKANVVEAGEDIEILRHQLLMAGKSLPKLGEAIDRDPKEVGDLVEALIETSQYLASFLPPGKRLQTSVKEKLTIHAGRQEFEEKLRGGAKPGGPTIYEPKPTEIVKGFYDIKTRFIHLTTDTKFGGDSKVGSALHEGIHRYSTGVVQTRLGEFINEGFTQHFADRVSDGHGMGIYTGHGYGSQLACARKLMGWSKDGEYRFARLYFRSESLDELLGEIMRRLGVSLQQYDQLIIVDEGKGLCDRIEKAP